MAGQFRSYVWDPALIISQIVCMQCIFYGGIGFWLLLLDTVIGRYVTIDQMFLYQEMQFKDGLGKLVMIANVLSSLTCAVGLWYVVQRTKQCLDFTVTMHIFHVFISWFVNSSFPAPLSWWLTCLVCVIITTLLGEFLCMRTEMKSIPVGSCAKADL